MSKTWLGETQGLLQWWIANAKTVLGSYCVANGGSVQEFQVTDCEIHAGVTQARSRVHPASGLALRISEWGRTLGVLSRYSMRISQLRMTGYGVRRYKYVAWQRYGRKKRTRMDLCRTLRRGCVGGIFTSIEWSYKVSRINTELTKHRFGMCAFLPVQRYCERPKCSRL